MRLGVDTGVQENKCLRAGVAAQPRAFRWLAPGPRTVPCLERNNNCFGTEYSPSMSSGRAAFSFGDRGPRPSTVRQTSTVGVLGLDALTPVDNACGMLE